MMMDDELSVEDIGPGAAAVMARRNSVEKREKEAVAVAEHVRDDALLAQYRSVGDTASDSDIDSDAAAAAAASAGVAAGVAASSSVGDAGSGATAILTTTGNSHLGAGNDTNSYIADEGNRV
jgi:hypothetical protein